jgi:antitoxin component YwqK of YwqJK toxin-antitoxin module
MRNSFPILAISILNATFSFSQTNMTPKEAFYYTLRVNNIDINNSLHYEGLGNSGKSYQWVDFYASYFDKVNYTNSINDEFKKVPFLTKFYNELSTGMNTVNFNKTFFVQTKQTIGTYDQSCSCFPLNRYKFSNEVTFILLDVKQVGNADLMFGNSFLSFRIGKFFNINDFDFVLKMKQSEAERFVSSGKDNYGNINRDITIKVIYNIVNTPFQSDKNNYYAGAYIHRLEFYNGTTLLTTSFPKYNYYDKVNLIKLKDGIDTVYYGNDEKPLTHNNLSLTSFYRVATYTNGRITGPVKDYYLNGINRMIGYMNNGVWDGQFIWAYNNGQKYSEATYSQGKINGVYTAWYPKGIKKLEENYNYGIKNGLSTEWFENGLKKTQANYKNNKQDGCEFNWDESGKCKTNSYWGKNGTYYDKNDATINSSKCACEDQYKVESNNSEPVKTSSASGQVDANQPLHFIGYYNQKLPDGDYKYVNRGTYYKSNSAEVTRVFMQGGIQSSDQSELKVQGNKVLATHIFINGFKPVNEKYNYTYSTSITFEDGTVFEKIENIKDYSYIHPECDLSIGYNTPSLKNGAQRKILYLNFFVKDNNSDAIVQGFYRFTLIP